MARPKKISEQLETIREKILDTALAILQENGPEAITIRAIAERMDVAPMSLYTYFESQSAILRALSQREMAKWRVKQQVFQQRAETEDILRVVEDLLRFFMDFAHQNSNLYRMAWVMPEVGAETSAESRQRMQATVSYLADLLTIGMERGVFILREPFLAAGTVLAMVNTPYILFHSGKLIDSALRDRMAQEVFLAAMGYLKIN